ncbi:hypothetical protein CYY_009977 [Polysphondylium violaceum]|uniref:Saposin B-type domain-containing protein n=1 Tax=Polysphondylium violaceum TaxID=133409 RepID=A0A8J4UUV6_9MYCE|nr:hypothetical protein CYY_009977 [Polysphondylium violaceum]
MKFLLALFAILAIVCVAQAKINKCEVCQIVVNKIESQLHENKTQEQIIHALEQSCKHLPKKYSKKCTVLVDTFGPILIKKVTAKDAHSALSICTKVRVCKKAHLLQSIESDFSDFSDFSDSDLVFATQEDVELVEAVEAVEAIQEVEEIEEVESGLLQKKHHFKPHNPFGKHGLKKYGCKVCTHIVGHVEKAVLSGKNVNEATNIASSSCSNFKIHPVVKLCKSVVGKVVHKMVDAIKRHENPHNVCKQVSLC